MRPGSYAIAISILLALLLQIMPMPQMVNLYRPDWVLLVLSYWVIALPQRVNIGVAFLNGIILDILLGTVIGVHAFALSANVYILAANYQRVRNYTVWQQAMIICVLVTFYHLVLFWLQFSLTKVPFIFELMWPAVTSMLLWPWLFLLLRKVRRQFILV